MEHWHIFSFETDFWDNETSKWGRNRIFYDEGTNRKWEGKGQEEDFGERWGGFLGGKMNGLEHDFDGFLEDGEIPTGEKRIHSN